MKKPVQIPFNKPFIVGKELAHIADAVKAGNIGADGRYSRRCAELLKERFEITHVVLTSSCTAALEMAAMLCDLSPGDEVILPSFTFVSTANAILRQGATPVFVDIRPDTLNLDEQLLAAATTKKTKAIFPVHYAGVACEMTKINEYAKEQGLFVVEDSAQGVNAFYHGQALGTLGDFGTYSFHETKNYISGQGGALCINSPEMIERAEIIRDKGTNRQKFLRGEIDKYTWVDVGSCYGPSDLICAFLYGQLEMLDAISSKRKRVFEFYQEHLVSLEADGLLRLPRIPEGCQINYHLFYVLLKNNSTRDALMKHLRGQGISAVFHYVPLHSSPMGKKVGRAGSSLAVTEELSSRLLRLPLYYEIDQPSQQRVVDEITRFLSRNTSPLGGTRSTDIALARD